MNGFTKPLFIIYEFLILIPILIVATILTALSTICLSYIQSKPLLKTIPPRLWSKLVCFLSFISVSVEGLEKIDPKKSYIFVANHQSFFDIWVIYGWLNNPFSWIMKKELRKIPFVGNACEAAGHIFIDRSSPIAAKKSIAEAEKKLINGNCIVVFPEGTRTHDGNVGSFKRGAFSIATDIKLPIVPMTIIGAYERMSRHTFIVTPGKIKLIIHTPIESNNDLSEQETHNLAKEVRNIVVSGFSQK
ncbi:MAG: 1-acyl-sn-glycerol-3-phosphate acyltransferase [Paludibacteraceae bacterium]|nr:1-acyl-sn-glycerol-3-phosphate acyltransferase [Paludibacteraceae bacterium]MBN2786959.1 1-acyl-sn-glycerol-3-phosphate acyltransferase [Paludibacteraceae bacterium]